MVHIMMRAMLFSCVLDHGPSVVVLAKEQFILWPMNIFRCIFH